MLVHGSHHQCQDKQKRVLLGAPKKYRATAQGPKSERKSWKPILVWSLISYLASANLKSSLYVLEWVSKDEPNAHIPRAASGQGKGQKRPWSSLCVMSDWGLQGCGCQHFGNHSLRCWVCWCWLHETPRTSTIQGTETERNSTSPSTLRTAPKDSTCSLHSPVPDHFAKMVESLSYKFQIVR